ncbi:hypothetical protein AHAT_38880 [Agarivorans sp. Toyoura001]|uniref:hypothetical protein n=1 Tax=Agarivorans sp. Toyoura001 TaxID=2283141 RepID=UPI0010F42647|nr:hypothetical protein [Agarivorans sp. Toyoura001]GDY27998.1 hypothetical protein AHAT_38880 [Agarivorans sp. Toyoura001]
MFGLKSVHLNKRCLQRADIHSENTTVDKMAEGVEAKKPIDRSAIAMMLPNQSGASTGINNKALWRGLYIASHWQLSMLLSGVRFNQNLRI